MQRQGRKVDFTGQDIYVGIDVHKNDWTVTIRTSVGEFKTFRQVADPDHLHRYLVRAFPGATFHAVYEAGFSGFWAYDRLTELGIETMVVHPPDIPTRDKDRRKKADRTDSRKLARHLQAGELDPIYVPEPEHRFARDLVRSRMAAVKKQTRVKNQIHSLLDRHGVRIPAELHPRGCWSRALLRWLEREPFHGQHVAQRALRTYVHEVRYWRERVKELGTEIRRLGRSEPYREVVEVLRTLPGIGTLVFLMGVKNLAHIVGQLMHHGMPPEKPVALVRWGTTPSQVTVSGTLSDIVDRVSRAGLKAPAVIVVGDVVGLRDTMQWFETRPLYGRTIVVTRAREQASDLVTQLTDLGAECIECPTIEIRRPRDLSQLDRAIEHLNEYHWIIFTSINGVGFFFDRLFENGLDVRALHSLKTASIGPATAAKLLEYGIRSDIVPESYRAESVVAAFKDEDIRGNRILLPRAAQARPILPVELTEMGARVDEIAVYDTVQAGDNAAGLIRALAQKRIDLVTFTSSSTVKNFKALLPADAAGLLQGVKMASIGPITSDTAREQGFDVHVTAETYTIAGLCRAIVKYFQEKSQKQDTWRDID